MTGDATTARTVDILGQTITVLESGRDTGGNLAVLFQVTESYTAGLPLWVQRGILGPLARLARSLGVDRSLARAYLEGA